MTLEELAAECAELRQRQDRMFRVLAKQNEINEALAKVAATWIPAGSKPEAPAAVNDLLAALTKEVR